MTKITRTLVDVECDLCHVQKDDEGLPLMESIPIPDRSKDEIAFDVRKVDICEFCKSKLLTAWNAYCE